MSKPTDSAPAVFAALAKRYPGIKKLKYFDNGSTARVFLVEFPIGPLRTKRIVKVFRHDDEVSKALGPTKVFLNEVSALVSTSHTNLIAIYEADFLPLGRGVKTPYYVMEYLPGAVDLDLWVKKHSANTTRDIVIDLLLQACQGIQALHKIQRIHCDIKFGNLLVGTNNTLKVADLGFSKVINLKGDRKTLVYTTLESLPRELVTQLQHMKDKRAAAVSIPRKQLDVRFDLHYFGRALEKLIALPELTKLLSKSDLSYLNLMCSRLSMDSTEPKLQRYTNIDDVIQDLRKLDKLFLRRAGVEELNVYTGTQSLRLPVTGSIFVSERVTEILSHPLFQRLNRVLQLGFTYYVYPGASHTRFEHSLGVFGQMSAYINALLADDSQPFFRQIIDEQKIATTLMAALLHDIGHHSFAHTFEDFSLAERHEDVAMKLISGDGAEKLVGEELMTKGPLRLLLEKQWPEVSLDALRWMIAGKAGDATVTEDRGWQMMKALLSGPLDVDKTDYLRRDAHHAGVEYGRSIDIARLANSLTGCLVGQRQEGAIGITWKGIQAAENIILARTQMFWVVYWHHAVRSANAMLAHACAAHLKKADSHRRTKFNHVLFTGSAHELVRFLSESDNRLARRLAMGLLSRQLYKRGIELDYIDHKELYSRLLDRKRDTRQGRGVVMSTFSREVAKHSNSEIRNAGKRFQITSDDVLIDIPQPGKDELGQIYVVPKGGGGPISYSSRVLSGAHEDWQNWVRTSRVFLHPRVPRDVIEVIRNKGVRIIELALRDTE